MREWFWERLVYLVAAFGIAALAVLALLQSARPAASGQAEDLLWFARCELQADRYIVCSVTDHRVDAYLRRHATMPAGQAFGKFVADYFLEKGCTVVSIDDGLRVNGVLFSWDTQVLANIACGGKPLRVSFLPDRMMISDLVNLYLKDGPSVEIKK